MMAFMDVQNGTYVMNKERPLVQISALGLSVGALPADAYLTSLNFNPDTVISYTYNVRWLSGQGVQFQFRG